MMPREKFEQIVLDELAKVPERFQKKLKNIVFVVEEEVSDDTREQNNLKNGQELLGHYQGVPLSFRGDSYGIGMTLPDVITIYQRPTEDEAGGDITKIRSIVRETVFHEVAHYLGMSEAEVSEWEAKQELIDSDILKK